MHGTACIIPALEAAGETREEIQQDEFLTEDPLCFIIFIREEKKDERFILE